MLIFYLNNSDLITSYNKYENKIKFEPEIYTEEVIEDIEQRLMDLKVDVLYLPESDEVFIPRYIDEGDKEEYVEALKDDPELMYRNRTNWSKYISTEEYLGLLDLIGYHLNKYSTDAVVFDYPPSQEDLDNLGEKTYFRMDDEGVLYMNVHVDEYTVSSNLLKSYSYTYKLIHNMYGKVNIR